MGNSHAKQTTKLNQRSNTNHKRVIQPDQPVCLFTCLFSWKSGANPMVLVLQCQKGHTQMCANVLSSCERYFLPGPFAFYISASVRW